ncbi:MAG: hypothetical protein HOG78_00980 [Rhodobacterales bacterium]|jgi:uncharacterized protein YbaR (Trm112 family)|nr:hypothetical protein [Rhodobacterales bacterium]
MLGKNLKFYRCPSCSSGDLGLEIGSQTDDKWIEEGEITCENCSTKYRITLGLPRFVPEVNYADTFGFQ